METYDSESEATEKGYESQEEYISENEEETIKNTQVINYRIKLLIQFNSGLIDRDVYRRLLKQNTE